MFVIWSIKGLFHLSGIIGGLLEDLTTVWMLEGGVFESHVSSKAGGGGIERVCRGT